MTLFQLSMNKAQGFTDDGEQHDTRGFHIVLRIWRLQLEWWFTLVKT